MRSEIGRRSVSGTGGGSFLARIGATIMLAGSILTACAEDPSAASETIPDAEAVAAARTMNPTPTVIGAEDGMISLDPILSWRQPGFEQRYQGVNFNSLRVFDYAERVDGQWESVTHQQSATFYALDFAAAGLDKFAILGKARDGDVVVELWTLSETSGAVVQHGELGAVVANHELHPKEFHKRRVFEGLTDHIVLGIEVDPELRFVVFAARSPAGLVTAYRLDCQDPDAELENLADSQVIPELESIENVQKFDHVSLGRVYTFETSLDVDREVLFVDSNHDGVFDGGPLVEGSTDRPYREWRMLHH
jgi:hypothetical protein